MEVNFEVGLKYCLLHVLSTDFVGLH
jgi:hypothetical protein